MRKKVVIFIILMFILIIGAVSGFWLFNKKIDDVILEKQNQIIKNIGVSDDNYYVYNKGHEYYIYSITDNKYICYFYKIHKNEEGYNSYKAEYRGNIKANLFYDDDSLFTRIKVDEGVVEEGFLTSLNNKHKGFNKLV